jgi:hypothetical protein
MGLEGSRELEGHVTEVGVVERKILGRFVIDEGQPLVA